ncbi:MAG: DNA double-strand break repair nuclease NurA [Sphaerospermopsis kisseleviana]|uniref:NurA domain-containing protein n=3 Tax=Sphaerospermopsis TaxID=752201 RepID=A0A479ZRA6_9CYAN|nr:MULTISPECIES: DNA double-strand break repair nuclease NurA [Sphaerospermopsis]BAZ82680.1 NurA domain-containing protein [Sphaerospermopsis kisseleviana NIES-73]MBC5796381.1 DNA double-strand break repair nuclease NurA [Sphaerospermopsis sp. LEGE 00249]MBD2130971.1 DNA double-strand break repair nuclease NurA [Sphaerospermopsis sp. FACHB-1094]MBD2144659.1 DNA double-strand break repair nuclease NurA [Sphaerospermopsis sp. FACHB-1194]MBE9234715.1 DNA double-strand break repair nuclease NurA [
MLDLTKLAGQMQGLSQHLSAEVAESNRRLELAKEHLKQACKCQQELMERQEKWRDRILFANATPIEPLETCIDIPVPPKVHTVIATDGSQIAPNHHEIAYCYLLNIGRVVLHYGQNKHPLLDSLPEVFYKPEDLYIARQWGLRTEEWMSNRRTASEITVLSELACSVKTEVPALAMVDGSLIYWFLDQLPMDARDRILPPILAAWQQLQKAEIPIIGYLSAARNLESTNFLRLLACPYPVPDCISYCPDQLDHVPCRKFENLRDTTLWTTQLKPGQRGPLWRSNNRILQLYEEQTIYFCYVHVGTEISRIEFPAWVANSSQMLDQALGLMLAQVQKGYGYPVAIAEAHNQAVVRGGDKNHFFALLEREMIKAGIKNVGISYKEARKRGSIA